MTFRCSWLTKFPLKVVKEELKEGAERIKLKTNLSDGFDVASKFAYPEVHFRSLCMKFSFSRQVPCTSTVLALPLHHKAARTAPNADRTALWEWGQDRE